MPQLTRVGTFIAEIKESTIGVTRKNEYPQWIARFTTKKYYAQSVEELAHYQITEPAFVEYPEEEILSYLVLFKSADQFDESTKMLNFDQAKVALGWDGTDFDYFNKPELVGRKVLIRVEENSYDGKVSLQVNWVDHENADPIRQLAKLDGDKLKALNAKLKMNRPQAPTKPATAAKPLPAAAATPAAAAAGVSVPKAPRAAKKETPAVTAPPVAAPPVSAPPAQTDFPAELTMMDAWELVNKNKGAAEDPAVADAWTNARGQVVPHIADANLTPAHWSEVAKKAIAKLAA